VYEASPYTPPTIPFNIATVASHVALNWTSVILDKLEVLSHSSLSDQIAPFLGDLSTTSLTTLFATVLALLFVVARSLMHRSSFSYPYANGGRSPYQSYTLPPNRDQLPDLVNYIDEDYTLLSPSSNRRAQAPPLLEDENEPDRIHITYRGDTWKLDFPPFSIAEEKVPVRFVRERVATSLGVDPGRVRLIYKDRELKRDETPLRQYGCKQNSEIAVVVQSDPREYESRRNQHSGSDSDSIVSANRTKKEDDRNLTRSGSSYRRRDGDGRHATSNGYLHPSHHSTPTSGNTPPRQPSPARMTGTSPATSVPQRQPSPTTAPTARRPSPRPSPTSSPRTGTPAIVPPADQSTPLGKIQGLRYEFHTEWIPKLEAFIRSPPTDRESRDKEYRRLNEIVYRRVFDAGDAIEPEGPDKDEMRTLRKTLYAEAHDITKDLDKFKPRDGK